MEGKEVCLIIPKPPVLQPEVRLRAYVEEKALFCKPILLPSIPLSLPSRISLELLLSIRQRFLVLD